MCVPFMKSLDLIHEQNILLRVPSGRWIITFYYRFHLEFIHLNLSIWICPAVSNVNSSWLHWSVTFVFAQIPH